VHLLGVQYDDRAILTFGHLATSGTVSYTCCAEKLNFELFYAMFFVGNINPLMMELNF